MSINSPGGLRARSLELHGMDYEVPRLRSLRWCSLFGAKYFCTGISGGRPNPACISRDGRLKPQIRSITLLSLFRRSNADGAERHRMVNDTFKLQKTELKNMETQYRQLQGTVSQAHNERRSVSHAPTLAGLREKLNHLGAGTSRFSSS